jgi:hypothetical protein
LFGGLFNDVAIAVDGKLIGERSIGGVSEEIGRYSIKVQSEGLK